MKKTKILHLITGLDVGGAEKVVFDLSLELNKRQYENFVVGISGKDFLAKMFVESGIKVEVLRTNKNVFSFIKGLLFLNKFIKENKVGVIHAHLVHALIMAVCVKFFQPNIKIVFTSHSFNLGSKLRKSIIMILKPFRNTDIIFSKKMRDKIYKKNAVVIPNGINASLYNLNIEKNQTFTFLVIGRIEAVKNHRFLVDVVTQLKNEFDFEIHIVGEGKLKEEFVNYIKETKNEENFKFLGYRKDVNIICNQSHVFLLTSLWEGLPISLLEAGASGMPVISTPVGSVPELIDKETGYIATLDEFADKMRLVYNNYSEALIKGKCLKNRIQMDYDLSSIVEQHIKIYDELTK